MGVHLHMLDVPRAPPNGTTKEPANGPPWFSKVCASLAQMAHTTPSSGILHWRRREGAQKKDTNYTYRSYVPRGLFTLWRHSIVSVKSEYSTKMPTLLGWRKTLKISEEIKLYSPEISRGMERNALLNPSPASGHDTGPNPFMHQIRLCW